MLSLSRIRRCCHRRTAAQRRSVRPPDRCLALLLRKLQTHHQSHKQKILKQNPARKILNKSHLKLWPLGVEIFAHKKTGPRCGGRGKSDIFSALQNALINNALKSSKIYTVLAKKCSYSGKIIPAVKNVPARTCS